MIEETLHAAHWWVQRIISYDINVEGASWQSHFEKVMTELLRAKYHSHWYHNHPDRGSGYRAISNEYSLDPILDKAAKAVSHTLHKYLAQMVLTSDDRWLVMFVNPGVVMVRNKRNHDKTIYDPRIHIFNKALRKRALKMHKLKSIASGQMLSKSDDDALGTLDETKSDDDGVMGTKSDPEDNLTTVDFKKTFMNAVQEKARKLKEKEIERHVRDFKEEMRLNHNIVRGFGPYDEEHSKIWHHNRSPSKSSAGGTTSTRSSASSRSSPAKSPSDSVSNAHCKPSAQSTSASPRQTHPKPTSPANGNEHHLHSAGKAQNGILNVLNVLNHNRFHHHHATNHHHHPPHSNGQSGPSVHFAANKEFDADCGKSNYGKHLREILESCRAHSRRMQSISQHHGLRNGTANTTTTRTTTAALSQREECGVPMDGGCPLLLATSFASPSPSVTVSSPTNSSPDESSVHEMGDEPSVLRLSKSEPLGATTPVLNGKAKIQKMKSTNHVVASQLSGLELNYESESSDDERAAKELKVGMLRTKVPSLDGHSEGSSETVSNPEVSCASSPIYDSATPPTNDEQNVSPSSNGSRSYVDEELKY